MWAGVIGIATAVFPSKIKGNCLDSFARKHLWEVGLDYLHGTSHGVGSFLNVHEGPMGISWRVYPNDPGIPPQVLYHTLLTIYVQGFCKGRRIFFLCGKNTYWGLSRDFSWR